ncbi:carboxylesterase 5A [Spodoptera litura]|uniref:Carboxylic ester hydrolase n=1 Tax=Spodoptera litura TaxID=69820 RepID=A0A9J7IQH4_SPOLT|nr:carboxylesterase 5A [Spodoptera litura]
MFNLLRVQVWCTLGLSIVLTQEPVTNLPQGRIVGIKAYIEGSNTPIEIYYGVPYATPPKGRYRFSAPERHTGWRRTFFAHRIPPHCPHIGDDDKDNYSEDCLYLNIWTPRRSDGKTLPVVVILFSESWIKGGVSLPCQELAAEGIVVVTVMYRLHLLAFFTLRTIAARGNLALLDQYLAMLWIRDNIAAFGGDPTAITLLGHSAGADSVLHHITSPRSLGLFRRAIIMSPFDIWKIIGEKVVEVTQVERMSREIAKALGCNGDTDHEILHCMRERPLSELMSLYSNDSWNRFMQPISDDFLPESEQFLPNSIMSGLTNPATKIQLDVLLGANDLEALNNNVMKYEELMKQGNLYAKNKVIIESLRLFSLDRSEMLPLLVEAVRWEYWNNKTRNVKEVLGNVEFLGRVESAAKWNSGIVLIAARLAKRVRRLFVYRYSQPAGVDLKGQQYNFTGAVHGSDLVSLLGDALMLQVARRPPTKEEKRVSFLLRRHLINFIQFGSPGEESIWQPYKSSDANVYDIHDTKNSYPYYHSAERDVRFWLQYLPQLNIILDTAEKTGKLTDEKDENRLRGGVLAMCGVTIVLLLLLVICGIILHRQKSRRFTVVDENHH